MNTSTTRTATPAAIPRTGRGSVALPRDEGLDQLLADPQLGSTPKTIAVALVKHWAWSKDHCWPSDRTIAAKIGKSPGHVQRCMRQLDRAGWIRRERTDEVPTGRRIWLTWRCPDGQGAQGDQAPAREDLTAPARNERVVVVNQRREPEASTPAERQRPEPIPPAPPTVNPEPMATLTPAEPVPVSPALPSVPLTPEQQARLAELPAAARDQVLLWLTLGDPILTGEARKMLAPPRPVPAPPQTLPELLGRIREDPAFPSLAADWLASALGDRKSYSGFKSRCEEAWRGELPVDRLVSAYAQATGPKAKNRGAIFMYALRDYPRDG